MFILALGIGSIYDTEVKDYVTQHARQSDNVIAQFLL